MVCNITKKPYIILKWKLKNYWILARARARVQSYWTLNKRENSSKKVRTIGFFFSSFLIPSYVELYFPNELVSKIVIQEYQA